MVEVLVVHVVGVDVLRGGREEVVADLGVVGGERLDGEREEVELEVLPRRHRSKLPEALQRQPDHRRTNVQHQLVSTTRLRPTATHTR